MLFKEIIVVYTVNDMKLTATDAKLLTVKQVKGPGTEHVKSRLPGFSEQNVWTL
jgi:hypothetical protein